MEFHTVLESRRSIRKFKPDYVSDELVLQGIQDGILAPSAHNRQPWKFLVASKEQKDKIAAALYEKTKDIVGHTGGHTAGIINDASRLVVVFIDNQISENRDMDMLSIGACIENIILSYNDMGLGSVWIGNTNIVSKEIKDILDVEYETVSSIAIGIPDQSPHMRPRKNIDEIIIQ